MDSLQMTIRTRLGERMVSMNSTLVETVSINYEDFNESFLTCGTCLCMYDGNEHTPKLLQCSHTVCLHCLTKIAASQTRDTGSFRCPICRELINIPRGGVSALPPSFLVNQLLDLMSRQRREVIPKCSVHLNQELLFCETCDTVFCTLCTNGSHSNNELNAGNNCEHTIIPFSIAIKRMSEILLYKANECIQKLTLAQDGVSSEIRRLDQAKDKCLDDINATFLSLQKLFDERKTELIELLNSICSEKRKILQEQFGLIECEKNKVEQECQGLQYQVEVRNITQKIESLSEKLDSANNLSEPRENSFLTCDFLKQNNSLQVIEEQLHILGRVRTSTTFPSLSTAKLVRHDVVVGVENSVKLSTVDYHGNLRKTGGDPIAAILMTDDDDGSVTLTVVDNDDGSYDVNFRPIRGGRHVIKLSIFDRAIKDSPLFFDVSEHNNPVKIYGGHGNAVDEFVQPVGIVVDDVDNTVYVLDTGNSRIKVLNEDLDFLRHLFNDGLSGRSCTGIAMSNGGLVVVNWRTKLVTEMALIDGDTVKQFGHDQFQEPIAVAFDKNFGHFLIADNGANCVFVFDSDGKILLQVGKKGTFSQISSVAVGPQGEIVVSDFRIQVFSGKGDLIQVLKDEGKGKGRYGGVAVDAGGKVLASRTEQKGRTFVQILDLNDKNLNHLLDSHDSKLKRPSGLAVSLSNHVVVVDLGNNCIKKFRYW